MKKIIFLLICSIFIFTQNAFAQCENTDAGNFPSQALEVCANETAIFIPSSDFILDDDDILVYMVHENPELISSEVLGIYSSSNINKKVGMNDNQTYYVSAVAGNEIENNGTVTVDFSDPCLSISVSSEISFLDATHDLSWVVQEITCFQDGGVFYSGATADYSFQWDDEFASTEPWLNVWNEGFYSVTITLPNGCTQVEEHFIWGNFGPEINNVYWGGTASCGPDHDYHIGFTFLSWNDPVTYEWTTPSGETFTTIDENELIVYEGGEYCVNAIDANGCESFNFCHTFDYPDLQCASIEGNIVKDDNDNCESDSEEISLANRLVHIFNEDFEYYDITDTLGNFSKDVLPGTYQVQAVETNLWEACPPVNVVLIDELSTVYAPLVMQAAVDCPLLSVDLASGLLRRCMDGQYSINYCNEGTISAIDAYIDLTLDENISIEETSLPFTIVEPGVYRFDLGDIEIGECGSINIQIEVSCSANNGQTLCSKAVIYPNEPCMMNANWNGASVEVSGNCTGDEIIFNIENAGTGNMEMPSEYIVIEDGVILMTEPIEFELDAGQIEPITYAANGSTYILQAMQVPNHPGMSTPTVAIEGCGVNSDGTTSTGFVTQFYLDETDEYVSEDCREVTGSYDPNDKTGFPRGYGDNHYIEKGQELEYLIRFQNTGNDTAFTVRIDDVLASELDITTLRAGASSHPYELNIRGADTLEFLFENILLPDSFVNEVASHGFVQFKIAQKADLELGTIIENTASIYFDFNEAIITNTTFHELGAKFVDVTNTQEIFKENLQAEISPNPIQNEFQLSLSGLDFQKGRIDFFDVNGRMVYLKSFTNNQVSLRRNGLSNGVYFYKIHLDGEFAVSGKVIFTP